MTVGAVIVPTDPEEALADAGGRIAIRRIVDAAWAGGALPIVVVLADGPDEGVAAAVAGSPATVTGPAAQEPPTTSPGSASHHVALFGLGVRAALEAVTETTALLLWPGRMTWVDPETVTSLIEAHGRAPAEMLRPRRAGQVGWPVLVPTARAADLLADDEPTLEAWLSTQDAVAVELGDPGSVLGNEVSLEALPDYAGPPEPVGGPPPEWGAAAADTPDPEVSPGPD